MRKFLFIHLLLFSISSHQLLFAQDSLFVIRSGSHLSLGNRPFYAVGVNSYFLQNLAAYGDTTQLIELLQTAKSLGVTTIRTWGFFDSSDSTNPASMQYAPGKFNENGLRALDYIIQKAKEYSLRLIIPLVNNWEDYGGMNQYVQWYANQLSVETKKISTTKQKTVYGVGKRSYRHNVSGSLTHDDFYTNATIKQWYKNYISMLLNRTNIFTNTAYKDEPAVLMWELANEPRSSDNSGEVVALWLEEMSAYMKSIDTNHLVSSGEEGYYNGNGVSFSRNLNIATLDIASVHCYIEPWQFTPTDGIKWMRDHQHLAEQAQKPLIVGEVGMEQQASLFYATAFNETYFNNTSGTLLWQLAYTNSTYTDAFAFSCPASTNICNVISKYTARFDDKRNSANVLPTNTQLLQNYPNPFNLTTVIGYQITANSSVSLKVYNTIGEEIGTVVNEVQEPGFHSLLFDAENRSSGIYFVRLISNGIIQTKKIILVK